VDKGGTVKLADFGASKQIETLATAGAGGCASIRGTPYWMAPEVRSRARALGFWHGGRVMENAGSAAIPARRGRGQDAPARGARHAAPTAPHGARAARPPLPRPRRAPTARTPPKRAAQVIKQTGHGPPADVWSVGCTVIEMATGRPPWPHCATPVAAMFQIASSRDPPPIPEHLSAQAKDFLLMCFSR
jgi:serine/threonine protein kinase